MSTERCIAHLDMDAFYASVELLRRPELRGKPVAIGGRGDPRSRGVVTTATYEARAFGIRSGMALRRAAELCAECVFLPVDFDEYRRYSRMFKAAIATLADRIEDRGIDEVYIDLTDAAAADGAPGGEPRASGGIARHAPMAREIKRRVHEATGLTCSIGLAPNKLLAKIASDLDKPDGLCIVETADIPTKIWPLPVRRINGVGPKADEKLQRLGIRTIGELAARPEPWLVEQFGRSYGHWLLEAALGRDEREVVTESEPRSRSRETTFERDMHPERDWHELAATLSALCRRVAADLRTRGYAGRTIGVKLRFDDFRIATRDLTLPAATTDERTIRKAAFECLARQPIERRLRLIGVRVGGLEPIAGAAPGASAAVNAAQAAAAAPARPAGATPPPAAAPGAGDEAQRPLPFG